MLVVYERSCAFCGEDSESLSPRDDCPECGFPTRLTGSHMA